ncbi:hypothetical protein AB0953_27690 [Streptomyces sp. NPDC046866]|uniref:hypothetical protein n=1 Tax=Streptomyces sp. NPDC046866 TaxID=3154921 RepID=UPI00345511F8
MRGAVLREELGERQPATDPAGGDSTVNDETGIIGLGRDFDRHLYVLADRSGALGANNWRHAACRLA